MKNILIIAVLFASCTTERQLQLQKGIYTATPDRHVRFIPTSDWKKIPFDTSFNGFIVRNIAIKKP